MHQIGKTSQSGGADDGPGDQGAGHPPAQGDAGHEEATEQTCHHEQDARQAGPRAPRRLPIG